MKKRMLSLLTCLALCLSLLPVTALAADGTADWAADAVKTLNTIYTGSESGPFSNSTGEMTEGDAAIIASSAGWTTAKVTLGSTTPLSRGTACEVLVDVFELPVPSGTSAIQYLYDQNIISSKANGDLAENDPVSKAEFAVLTYRVLNFVGGGLGSSVAELKPGTEEYFAWMYLAVRKCVPFETAEGQLSGQMSSTELATSVWDASANDGEGAWVDQPKKGEDLWNAWAARLHSLLPENVEPEFKPTYNMAENTTLLEAAKMMVNEYMKAGGSATIFSDVQPDDWHYDGIMYLANQNIVIGHGDGQFGPNDTLPRFQFALLLSIMDGTIESTDTNPDRIYRAVIHVLDKEYMSGTKPTDEDWDFNSDIKWGAATKTTREEALAGILMMIKGFPFDEMERVNTAILDRFTDKGQSQIPTDNFKLILAYAVSMGLLSGTSENKLSLTEPVTRAQVGVLAYRTRIGLDSSKMKDYKDNVTYVFPVSGSAAASPVVALPMARTGQNVTLTLREDWRLTSDLDLQVPADTTLTIVGNGHHIYEMGGKLTNSGSGTVTFAEGTALYPAAGDENINNITPEGIWDAKESNALMVLRAGEDGDVYYKVKIDQTPGGTITVDKLVAKANEQVTVTAAPIDGYGAGRLAVQSYGDGGTLDTTHYFFGGSSSRSFTMPDRDVTISVNFGEKPAAPSFSPVGGAYTSPQSVTIASQTDGAAVYYTTDGSTPTSNSIRYNGPITIDKTTTLKAVAVKGDVHSDVTTAAYTISTGGGSTGGGNGGSSDPTYSVTLPGRVEGGTVTANKRYAEKGETFHFTVTPDEGWELDTLTVTDRSGKKLEVTHKGGGVYAFQMPAGQVEIEISFREVKPEPLPFTDVREDTWYSEAVRYVYEHGLMAGTGAATFGPDVTTSRSMIATILWRIADSPVVNYAMNFSDVPQGQWYSEAVRWAVSEGVVSGYGDGSFGTNDPITREQFALMLWRLAQNQGYDVSVGESTNILSYTDVSEVSEYAIPALQWAVGAGIISGTGDGSTLSPQGQATRAQAAVMLMRFCEKYVTW
ncbi:hypothetical protein DWX58_00555 [Pseudoflavonifractor sp. AF19-9AC]|uniref:S-layer homology domain-containing protein n=1 Tax=Pseudoflavonifractor sp. AF19-9AC TaxID=2292244 RepID=UPI000E49BE85|nr:S-layer homology domain-containing protein [Pseudoflavonifractor sp. AF19-9AC]RHR10987.1 hypothetical protein DWX58_00555 [Pseudoflavonifractor sp. AF19-9AC]